MDFGQEFQGVNAGYVAELYERYRRDPLSVEPAARQLFERWTPPDGALPAPGVGGVSDLSKVVGAVLLAQAIRGFGHLAARLDPLGSAPPGDPALLAETHGLNPDDLWHLPASLVGGPAAEGKSTA